MGDLMKYEVGKWYGWNGGECPVHPETVVEVVCLLCDDPYLATGKSCEWDWRETSDPVIAFRIIKEHKYPREFWAREMTTYRIQPNMPMEDSGSEWVHCNKHEDNAVLFREVTE